MRPNAKSTRSCRSIACIVTVAIIATSLFAASASARGPRGRFGFYATFGHGHWHPHHFHRPRPILVERSPVTAAIDAAGLLLRDMLAPPPTAVPVYVGGVTYWRDGNVYYRSVYRGGRTVYVVTPPPPQVVVVQPSQPTPETVIIGGQTYCRTPSAGPATSQVVPRQPLESQQARPAWQPAPATPAPALPGVITSRPAVGTIVAELPSTAVSTRIGGTDYYFDRDVYYLPIRMPEGNRYIVVERPPGVSQL